MPEVVLASGDEASGLANMLGTLLAQNVERHPEKYRDAMDVSGSEKIVRESDSLDDHVSGTARLLLAGGSLRSRRGEAMAFAKESAQGVCRP